MAITQEQAKYALSKIMGRNLSHFETDCTGNADTCPIDECLICGVRECPFFEPLHYHHDGCPACDVFENSNHKFPTFEEFLNEWS